MATKPLPDQTLAMLARGYEYGTGVRRRVGVRCFRTRILGRPAVCGIGEDAVRALYDPGRFERRGVLPRAVRETLTGRDAVHTLDGSAHRHRKTLLLETARDRLADLAGATATAWDQAAAGWTAGTDVVLFDAADEAITRGACAWAGVRLLETEAPSRARDLVAMVDGFATPTPRHVAARRARRRCEDWLETLVADVRRSGSDRPESACARVAGHRDEDGRLLPARLAGVELLNLIRPAVAVAWFVTFGAHAMRSDLGIRRRVRGGDPAYLGAFVHELRRHYPFAPYVGGRALDEISLPDAVVHPGDLLLIDVYGHHHDPVPWPDPDRFRPERFEGREIGAYDLIPQGGGDPGTGHRCPGEPATIALLETLLPRIADLPHGMPPQDLSISLRRVPARVASGYRLTLA